MNKRNRKPSIKPPRYGWRNGIDSLLRVSQIFAEYCLMQDADWTKDKKWRRRYKYVNKFKHDPLRTFLLIQKQWNSERNGQNHA